MATADRDERASDDAALASEDMPSLTIARDKVCFLIIKGREFDVKDAVTAPDDGSDPPDDGMRSVLEDRPDDPVRQELAAFINALTIDEQLDLVALTWLGRGDGSLAEWAELRETAANEHSRRTASYLLGNPMLPDHLAEGLAEFGHTCEEFAAEHFRV